MRILIVEDEPRLGAAISRGLRREGFGTDLASDGADALAKLAMVDYDVVLLDRDIPVVHGDDVCRQAAAAGSRARILMLTASGTLDDRVEGLGLGADDYLSKPFAFTELVARVRALGRRSTPAVPPILDRKGIVLDPGRRAVEREGHPIALSPKEFGLLEELMKADGRVLSAEALLERVWDENADPFTNVVRVSMATLRKKLGDPPVIETIIGAGYRL